jgi:hypothetical protein
VAYQNRWFCDFLNGDNMAVGPASPTLERLSRRVLDEQWWDALALQPAFAPC